MRYWVHTISRRGDNINDGRLKRTSPNDRIVFYSPRPQQCFTAIGEIAEDRTVNVLSRSEAAIQPLIDSLDFIRDKKSWGVFFRRGFFEIMEPDFRTLERAMALEAR
jgi:hypothetical protein